MVPPRASRLHGASSLAACVLAASCASSGSGGPAAGAVPSAQPPAGRGGGSAARWVGTWGCSPQLTEPGNMPPAPGLSGNTLRQSVFVSIGGRRLRVRLSNAFGDGPLAIGAVRLASSRGGAAIDAATDRALTFGGASAVTIPAGGVVISDPLAYDLTPLSVVAVTIHFGAVPAALTGHPGSRTTSYLQPGDAAAAADLPEALRTDHWYVLTGIDVVDETGGAAALVTVGDSLTDGRGSTTNGNDRWPDNLSRRLRANPATARVAVLNQGIGGNAVLARGLGPPAVQRFPRDVLEQPGVRWMIVFEGVNDIGLSAGPAVASDLIAALGGMAQQARARGIRAYGATLLPFEGSQYFSAEHEAARRAVNDWIRTGGAFDAVVDFEAAVRDPDHPARLAAAFDGGDHLHLNPAGYRALADAVDLALFAP